MKRLLIAALAVGVSVCISAQQLPSVGDALARIPGLDKILGQKDALTTGLDTATSGVPWLDLFEPASPQPMDGQPRSDGGGFTLGAGGFYEMRVQSFCLQAGARRPAQGDGFLDAPLGGPAGLIVQHILENAAQFPQIPQDDIQMLLWSILARAKVTDLPRELQAAAAQLLTPTELTQINGSALGLLAGSVRDAAFERLPPAVARILSAEADIRELVSKGRFTYADMADAAVPSESADAAEGDEIPSSRWNFRDGLYVRYQPSGYSESLVQVYVPAPTKVAKAVRDAKGRLARLIDPANRLIEIAYADAASPLSFDGDAGVKAWPIRHITYSAPGADGRRELIGEADVDAWTLVGVPNGKGKLRGASAPRPESSRAPRFAPAVFASVRIGLRAAVRQDDGDLVGDLQARYNRAAKIKGYVDKASGQGHQSSASDVLDEDHYRDGIDKAKKLDFKGEGKWFNQHNESVGKLAAWSHCEMSGGCSPEGSGGKRFNPGGKAGVPAAGQRIGMSGRPAR